MNIVESNQEGVVVLRVGNSRIDAASAAELRSALGAVVDRGVTRFVLDRSSVDFVDSTGLIRIDKVVQTFPTNREDAAALAGGAA
jgi:anti-anti-sigma regulatory factor